MKVTHIVWSLATGGVETMLVNIINEQVKYIDVQLIVINDNIYEPLLNKISHKCDVRLCRRKPGKKDYFSVVKVNWWLTLFRPHIIHVHSKNLKKFVIGNYKIVRTIHNTRNITKEYPEMAALYAISNTVKEYTAKQGFPNVTVVENGIRVSDFQSRESLGSNNSIFHIVQVGRLFIKQKGQEKVLEALEILIKNRAINCFIYHIIGEGPDEKYLKDLVCKKGLEKYVIFEGLKSQEFLQNNLKKFDLFIQPSNYEGFGLTVAEAMAAKVPVLVSDIEGPMEIIDNGKYGMHFRKGDIENLANKLETIMKGGYDYSMIEPAYEYVKTHYDVSITAKKYIEEYKKVIN